MDTERNWGAEPWRAPGIEDGDSLIFSECGRVMDNIDYRSHYFRLVKAQYGGYFLLVRHGGGQERIQMAWSNRLAASLAALDSDCRYFMLHTLHKTHRTAAFHAGEETAARYKAAYVAGTLRKRKLRGQDAVRVWIERAPISKAA